jgi:hypothetical protein
MINYQPGLAHEWLDSNLCGGEADPGPARPAGRMRRCRRLRGAKAINEAKLLTVEAWRLCALSGTAEGKLGH